MAKKQELAKVPGGGILRVDVSRYTVSSADLKLFTVLVLDPAGQEKLRKKIENGVVAPSIVAGQPVAVHPKRWICGARFAVQPMPAAGFAW